MKTRQIFVIAVMLLGLAIMLPASAATCPEIEADTSRIVVSGGSLTEIIYDLGLEAQIVAVDRTSNYPEAALALPQIGYVRALSAEGVLSAEPTLLLGEDDTGPPEVLDQLRAAELPIAIVGENHSANGIIDKVRCMGRILDAEAEAEAFIKAQLIPASQSLESDAESGDRRRPRGAVLLGVRDGLLIAAGGDTSGNGLLEMMSADNVLADVTGWKPVSIESMLAANPEFLVIPQRGLDSAGGIDGLVSNASLRLTEAAKNRQVYAMDGMAMLGFGPRTLSAAADLSQDIRESATQDN
ncbi:MAG: ABC transporter substrate-binding protein [Pseudomonadota bacterium]